MNASHTLKHDSNFDPVAEILAIADRVRSRVDESRPLKPLDETRSLKIFDESKSLKTFDCSREGKCLFFDQNQILRD